MSFKRSKIIIPRPCKLCAICVPFDVLDNKLVYGYNRMQTIDIPNDIIEIIASFYRCDWIHIFDFKNGDHWKIAKRQIYLFYYQYIK